MIRPIPLAMLIHEVIYEQYKGADRYGIAYKEPIILKNVLIQPATSMARGGSGDSVAYNSLLFFDCTNSKPSDIAFVKDSKITFNNQEMILDKINPIYTFNLHHYELELI